MHCTRGEHEKKICRLLWVAVFPSSGGCNWQAFVLVRQSPTQISLGRTALYKLSKPVSQTTGRARHSVNDVCKRHPLGCVDTDAAMQKSHIQKQWDTQSESVSQTTGRARHSVTDLCKRHPWEASTPTLYRTKFSSNSIGLLICCRRLIRRRWKTRRTWR